MNSSGIKRGLAVSAISALAVAGIPALASPASAETGDVATVAYTGPIRNAGNVGGLIVLKTKGIDSLADAQARLQIVDADLVGTDTLSSPAQTVVLDRSTIDFEADDEDNEFGGDDGFDEVSFRVTATTPSPGDAVRFAAYFNDVVQVDDDSNPATPANDDSSTGGNTPGDGTLDTPVGNSAVDSDEARVQIDTVTSGPVASLTITPANQTAPAGQESEDYTLTLRDSDNRLTQLTGNEDVDLSVAGGNVTLNDAASDDAITGAEAIRGTVDFSASVATGATNGLRTITAQTDENGTATGNDDPDLTGFATATLDVVSAASITRSDIDVVTAADSWNGRGDSTDGDADGARNNPVAVRVDQNSIVLDIDSDDATDAGGTVVLTVATAAPLTTGPVANRDNPVGDGLTFAGGKTSTTVSTTLDAQGRGSITITPDAGTIQENDRFTVAGSGLTSALEFQFQRSRLSVVDAPADVYVSAVDGSVDITVTATDQFGAPVAGAQVDAQRTGGVNQDANAQPRKTTDANGQATFTFADVNAVQNQTSTVTFRAFRDAASATAADTDTAQIRYTTDGLGADYTITLDGQNTGGAAYTANNVRINPLNDGVADDDTDNDGITTNDALDEIVRFGLIAGENGAPFTVSVDNDARILRGADDTLAEGSASESGVVNATGANNTFRIVGTKSGVVTVTVTSAGRTETAQFTVKAPAPTAARNVAVSGPAEAVSGDQQAVFTAVVTDAFGNPVQGVSRAALNVQVSGPGFLQDSDAVTNAAGQLSLNVRLDDNASGTVTVRVTGLPSAVAGAAGNQFGAAEGRVQAGPAAPGNIAEGFSASSNDASASIIVKDEPGTTLPPATIVATASGSNRASDGFDRVRISVDKPEAAAGAAVELWKINKEGKARRVKTKALNDKGFATWIRVDNNGKRASKYFAKVRPTDTSKGDRSNTVRIK
jgi:hypothetical protein